MKNKVLVTGAAGFIGAALIGILVKHGYEIIGIDNLNNYYDPRLKIARLANYGIFPKDKACIETVIPEIGFDNKISFESFVYGQPVRSCIYPNLIFIRMDISDKDMLPDLFSSQKFDYVINLAAQAGVRYSILNPWAYVESNIIGFLNVLECCRHHPIKHFVYASSSSVYGMNDEAPFHEYDNVDRPVSMYAATKKSDELMAFSYSKLYGIRATGLRYFTVYGPWGRPDMAPMLFANAISSQKPINVFNNGDLIRDFTYIDDIVNGTMLVMESQPLIANEDVQSKVYNIGCSRPVKLMDFVSLLERALGKKAEINYLPMQSGDVYMTSADTTLLETEVGYKACVDINLGIKRFADWYKCYYNLK